MAEAGAAGVEPGSLPDEAIAVTLPFSLKAAKAPNSAAPTKGPPQTPIVEPTTTPESTAPQAQPTTPATSPKTKPRPPPSDGFLGAIPEANPVNEAKPEDVFFAPTASPSPSPATTQPKVTPSSTPEQPAAPQTPLDPGPQDVKPTETSSSTAPPNTDAPPLVVPIATPTEKTFKTSPKPTGILKDTSSLPLKPTDGPTTATLPTAKASSSVLPGAAKDSAQPGKKNTGAVAGGVIGAFAIIAILAAIGFFLWKYLQKRRAERVRASFGPFGNGIDANRGDALTSALPPVKPEPFMTEFERNDFTRRAPSIPAIPALPPVASRPAIARKPVVSTITEKSERDSQASDPKGPPPALNQEANPFGDSHAVKSEKTEPTLPHVTMREPLKVTNPDFGKPSVGSNGAVAGAALTAAALAASRSGPHHGQGPAGPADPRSLSQMGQREDMRWPAPPNGQRPQMMAAGAMPPRRMLPPRGPGQYDPRLRGAMPPPGPIGPQGYPPGPPGGPGPHPGGPGPHQGAFRYPSPRDRYPPGRLGDGPGPLNPQRRRRSRSMEFDNYGPRNLATEPPSWQRWGGPSPPARDPRRPNMGGPYYQEGGSMSETGLHRRPSAASIRERIGPEQWGQDVGMSSAQHHQRPPPQQQGPPVMMRPSAAQSQPDLSVVPMSSSLPSASPMAAVGDGASPLQGALGRKNSKGAAARNF